MQYHCLSLLEAGHFVTAIGYKGEGLIAALQDERSKSQSRFQDIRFSVPHYFKGIPLLYFIWRVISLTLYLSSVLLFSISKHPVDFVLVQNPPAIPLLGVAYLFCRYQAIRQKGRRPGLIIDWHNLGYSMLRKGSAIQRIAKAYESLMAPLADGHFTVTKAMKEYLISNMNVCKNIDVLYDCPPSMFEPLPVLEQHAVLSKLNSELCAACPSKWSNDIGLDANNTRKTLFTEQYTDKNGAIAPRHRPGRPALVTSSTSWTEDEDFGLLLTALERLDSKLKSGVSSAEPALRVMMVVTGKGPQRAMYEELISRLQLDCVGIATVWLEAADYPKLLACADVGISLHTSTSGLDLPMKVLDLFGCEVPALAYDFSCLHELVQDRVNGRIFSTSDELANLLYELLLPLQSRTSSMENHSYGELKTYSDRLRGRERWHTNWIEHALPVLMLSTPKS